MAKSQGLGLIAAIGVGIAGVALLVLGVAMMELSTVDPPYRAVPGGDLDRGRNAIRKYNCGQCHTIPGVPGAIGTKGQPLIGLGARVDIVGALPNTPDDVIRWIQKPKSIYPDTSMPELNVTDKDARDIVAYLYSIPPQ